MNHQDSRYRDCAVLIDQYQQEMIQFQKDLTRIKALGPENHGQGEWARAKFLIQKLKTYGLSEITEINAPDNRVMEKTRPNLVVRLKGKQSNPTVWIMAHMDVVPPGDEKMWNSDPFEVVEKDGKLFGRGVEDNQQGLVSAIFAMRALVQAKAIPTTDVGLMLVSDEETGNKLGVEYVLNTAPDLVKPEDMVIVPDSGNPEGTMVEVAEKSILWVEFKVHGKQVHASMPHAGINAQRAGANLMVELDQALHTTFSKVDPVYDPPISTFEPTKREANVPNVNTIPGLDHFFFDCRILPEYPLETIEEILKKSIKKIEQKFNVKIEFSYPANMPAAPPTPVQAPVVKTLSASIREVLRVEPKPMGIGGGTVAAVFRRRNIGAVVWSTMDDLAHQPNEYCVIKNMVSDAKVFAHVFLRKSS